MHRPTTFASGALIVVLIAALTACGGTGTNATGAATAPKPSPSPLVSVSASPEPHKLSAKERNALRHAVGPPTPKTASKAKASPRRPSAPGASSDQQFLDRLRDGTAPSFDKLTDAQAVHVAHAVCNDWNSGQPWEAIYAAFSDYDPTESAYFMASAGEAYCKGLYRYMQSRIG